MRGAIAKGEKITELRTAAGLTQERLATLAQCDVKTLRSAERSKRMDVATLRRIAERLGVDFRDIVAEIPRELREINIAAVERYIRAFNARDPEAVAQSFDEGGVNIVMADPGLPGAGEFRGREQIREWARICFETFRAEQITEEMYQLDAVGDLVFARVEQPLLEYLPKGKKATVSLISEFEIRDGRIAMHRTYPESGAIERMAFESGPPNRPTNAG